MAKENVASRGVVPQPNDRKVIFRFRMVDGGPFIIVTEELWNQKKRVFIVHGQKIDELTNVYSYLGFFAYPPKLFIKKHPQNGNNSRDASFLLLLG
jgi:hypothetical protein